MTRDAVSLEQRIAQAERAVVERDQRVRARAGELAQRVSHNAGRKLAIGGALAAGGLALYVFARRRWRERHPPRHIHARESRRGGSRLLPALFTLALPFLPAQWQRRLSPGGRAAIVGVLLPLAAKLFGRGHGPPPKTAAFVDLDRYAGHWYEIARLPVVTEHECASDAVAHYRALGGGRFEVVNRCRDTDGHDIAVHGEARVADTRTQARLQVSFAPPLLRALPFVWADYWVLDIDPDYRHALVGTPDREQLWVLSRSPAMPAGELARLLAHAEEQGYDTSRVLRTLHLQRSPHDDDEGGDDAWRDVPPRSEAQAAAAIMR